MNTARRALLAGGMALGLLVTGTAVAAPPASAGTKLTCSAHAIAPKVGGPNTIVAAGAAKAVPGSSWGLAIIGQNVDNVNIELELLRISLSKPVRMVVATDGHSEDGTSLLGRLLNDTSDVTIGEQLRYRVDTGAVNEEVVYRSRVTASCRTTGGDWVEDVDTSAPLRTNLGY